MLFTRRHENSNYKTIDPFFYYYLFISHAQTITIHYIYNSLQATVIVYRKEKKKEKQSPQKYYSLYINNYEKAADPTEILLSWCIRACWKLYFLQISL